MARKQDITLAPKPTACDPMHHCCAWTSGVDRCHYPGVRAHTGSGDRKWFCSAHFDCEPGMGAQILDQSHRDIPYPDYSFDARMAMAARQMDARYNEAFVLHEARAVCKLSTTDERRGRITGFEGAHGQQAGELLRATVKAMWEKRAA